MSHDRDCGHRRPQPLTTISAHSQDDTRLISQQRTAAGQESGKFDDEIAALPCVKDDGPGQGKPGTISEKEVNLVKDECNRPGTHAGRPGRRLQPVRGPESTSLPPSVTPSQLFRWRLRLCCHETAHPKPARTWSRWVSSVAQRSLGCEQTRWAFGPVFRDSGTAQAQWLTMRTISGLWELNEAFAPRYIYCRGTGWASRLENLNVNGGSIAMATPLWVDPARVWTATGLSKASVAVRSLLFGDPCVFGGWSGRCRSVRSTVKSQLQATATSYKRKPGPVLGFAFRFSLRFKACQLVACS